MNLRIFPPEELAQTPIVLPLSKSESNRQLIINALIPDSSEPAALAKCDDTDAMVKALKAENGLINIGAAGTAMRFLTAYFACKEGAEVTLDGSERMRRRPIAPLVEALTSLGADIEYQGEEGFPPLKIRGRKLAGGEVTMDAGVSSQYVSALLMIAPAMSRGLTLRLRGQLVSVPYIRMTLGLMAAAGVNASFDEDLGVVKVPAGVYVPSMPPVEADWSAASYWFAIAAISSESVVLRGLRRRSLQGDSIVGKLFEVTGLRSEFDAKGDLSLFLTPDAGSQLQVDLSDTPDLAQTLAVGCCLLSIPFVFTGLQTLRIKETDRLAALQKELSKLGFVVDVEADSVLIWRGMRFDPGEEIEPIATYDDHRMAMAFAPAALFYPGLQINGAEVVSKSYPDFWEDMKSLGFEIVESQS